MTKLGASTGDAPRVNAIELASKVVSATSVQVGFSGVPGRDPAAAGDYVGIWEGEPWDELATQTRPVASTEGSLVFEGLVLGARPYTVAYSAGSAPSAESVVAVQAISPGGIVGRPHRIHLAVAQVGSTSLTVSYNAPFGAEPLAFGHELVLVQGEAYETGQSPLATAQPTGAAADTVSFQGLAIGVGAFYTVAYLAGPQPANLAATLTFKVAG